MQNIDLIASGKMNAAYFAQGVADLLVDAGVKGIWNFAPIKMKVPETMHIVNEDLSVGLSTLSYHITRM